MRIVKNVFEARASRVVRCLLLNPGKAWALRELAAEAQVSLGYSHAVIAALTRDGYTVRNETGHLDTVNPIGLLTRWAGYHLYTSINRFLDYYTFVREIDLITDEMRSVKQEYALASLSGAWLVAPRVRPVVVETYVKEERDAEAIAKSLQLVPIPRGGNVRFVIPYDTGVFYKSQNVEGVKVASNVQLYVDLVNYPARGEEAARGVFKSIQGAWSQALLGGADDV